MNWLKWYSGQLIVTESEKDSNWQHDAEQPWRDLPTRLAGAGHYQAGKERELRLAIWEMHDAIDRHKNFANRARFKSSRF